MKQMGKVSLSIVVAARNDDHGGQFLARFQLFIDHLIGQGKKFAKTFELIIVEWNPPPDRPRLEDILDIRNTAPVILRIITVPPAVHRRFRYAERLPLFQMIAKNVGIRRASGEFVLCTNADVLFSDSLFAFCTSGKLDSTAIYRIDRTDVAIDPATVPALIDLVPYCQRHAVRLNSRDYSHNLVTMEMNRLYPEDCVVAYRIFDRLPPLHTNGCGDFQLMSKAAWSAIGGYPEFETYSLHLDSLVQYQAHQFGIREIVLDQEHALYHIEHEAGWKPEDDRRGAFNEDLKSRAVPLLTVDQIQALVESMKICRIAYAFNAYSWGLADELFEGATTEVSVVSEELGHSRADTPMRRPVDPMVLRMEEARRQFIAECRQAVIESCLTRFPSFELWLDDLAAKNLRLAETMGSPIGAAESFDLGGRRIVIYGAGHHARNFLVPLLRRYQIDLAVIIDDSTALEGQEIDGVTVVGLDRLDAMGPVLIIVSAIVEVVSVCGRLERLGFRPVRDVLRTG